MPRVRALKHPRWTGRVWRCNHTPDGIIITGPVAILYVFIEGVTPWGMPSWRRHWVCVVGHEIGNPRRVWRFEFDTRLGLPWVRDVTCAQLDSGGLVAVDGTAGKAQGL